MLMKLCAAQKTEGKKLQSMNRCRIYQQVLFLSDMVSANGRQVDTYLTVPLQYDPGRLMYNFAREEPTARDWILWFEFWDQYTEPGGVPHSTPG